MARRGCTRLKGRGTWPAAGATDLEGVSLVRLVAERFVIRAQCDVDLRELAVSGGGIHAHWRGRQLRHSGLHAGEGLLQQGALGRGRKAKLPNLHSSGAIRERAGLWPWRNLCAAQVEREMGHGWTHVE